MAQGRDYMMLTMTFDSEVGRWRTTQESACLLLLNRRRAHFSHSEIAGRMEPSVYHIRIACHSTSRLGNPDLSSGGLVSWCCRQTQGRGCDKRFVESGFESIHRRLRRREKCTFESVKSVGWTGFIVIFSGGPCQCQSLRPPDT